MRNPNKFRETAIRLFLSVELFVVLLISFTNKITFSILGIAAIVIYYILNLIFWTCPECKKFCHGPVEKFIYVLIVDA